VQLHPAGALPQSGRVFRLYRGALNKVPGMRDICSHIVMKTLKDSRHQLPLHER
jgi:hypothetical protein